LIAIKGEFDGSAFRCGKFVFPVKEHVFVEGFKVPIPLKYALLMLEGDEEAWRFAERVDASQILENEKVNILELAAAGMDAAAVLLNRYERDAPRGEPRPYSFCRRREDSSTLEVFLHITDGRQCYELSVLQCMSEAVAQLPPNVYVRPQRIPGVIVENEAVLEALLRRPREAFALLGRLSKIASETPSFFHDRLHYVYLILREFARGDEEKTHRMLERLVKEGERRGMVNGILTLLEKERALKCAGGGYIVSTTFFGYFYVTEDGRVFKLAYRRRDLEELAIYRLVTGKRGAQVKMIEIEPQEPLRPAFRSIASALVKARPDLIPVIIP